MIHKEFKVKGTGGSEYRVITEHFSSLSECVRTVEKRSIFSTANEDCAYLQKQSLGGHRSTWCGFESPEDMKDICLNGLHESPDVDKVIKYSSKALAEKVDKLVSPVLDVAGGGVDVPEFLSGSPECMRGLKRKHVRSRVVKVAVDTEVMCDISVGQYIKAGMAIAGAVASLEKAGYRVRLTALAPFYNDNRDAAIMSAVVKRENEPCNFRRLLMPMMSTAFFRGIGFNWVVCLDTYHAGFGLGTRITSMFDRSTRDAQVRELYAKATGSDVRNIFRIDDIIGMIQRSGEDATEKFLRANMLDLEVEA